MEIKPEDEDLELMKITLTKSAILVVKATLKDI